MKFDARRGDQGLVRDADGHEVEDAVSGDTETGVVTCLVRGDDGTFLIDEGAGEAATMVRVCKPPLTLGPLPGGAFRLEALTGPRPCAS